MYEILRLYKTFDLKKVTAMKKIGTGSNSVVYLVSYEGASYIVKELYPEGLHEKGILTRTSHGHIILRKWPYGLIRWNQARCRFFSSIRTAYILQSDPLTAQGVVHLSSVWIGNGSIYTITDDQNGSPWDTFTEESPELILQIGSIIATHCHEIHQRNFLLVDIKASNFLVKQLPGEKVSARLTDFDSLVSMNRIFCQKQFRCSSETAPPEMLSPRPQDVGTSSDVYCLAAMLFRKLGGQLERGHIREGFTRQIATRLSDWSSQQRGALLSIFLEALEVNPRKRIQSCQEFALKIQDVLNQRGISYENL